MIDQTFPVTATARVEVRTQSGEIRFVPGTAGEIRIVADARPHAELEVYQRGETVVVTTSKSGWIRSDDAHVTVYAPLETEAIVSTGSADIRSTTPLSLLEVNVASGDLVFESVNELRVRTASGDVRGDTIQGPADVVSASGDLSLGTCNGKATCTSASGDVEIGIANGPIVVATTSGELNVERCHSPEVSAKSMSGSVRIGLPAGTRVDLDARTLSGSVKLPKPSDTAHEPSRATSIKARLVSGDVILERVSGV